jgi:hypothetical protein
MNHRTVKFGRSTVLSALFFLTTFTLPLGQRGVESTWNTIHIWAGSLLLVGAVVHLVSNLAWVKSVFSRPARELQRRVRQLRHSNLTLFLFSLLCAASGILWLIPYLSPTLIVRVANFHRIAGALMAGFLGLHLLLHWRWLVAAIRQLSKAHGSNTRIGTTVGELE